MSLSRKRVLTLAVLLGAVTTFMVYLLLTRQRVNAQSAEAPETKAAEETYAVVPREGVRPLQLLTADMFRVKKVTRRELPGNAVLTVGHFEAHRIVHDRSRAEDVIHDAFAQILRYAKNFDPARGSARGWIYAIVRNTALKMQENARRELALEEDALNAICERGQSVPNPASCIPDSMTLRTMLDELEPNRRASLLLAIIDGRTHEEIAEYLQAPVGTVKAWIRRELMAMRRQLE